MIVQSASILYMGNAGHSRRHRLEAPDLPGAVPLHYLSQYFGPGVHQTVHFDAQTQHVHVDSMDCAWGVKMDSIDEKDGGKLSGFRAVLPAVLPISPPLL